MRPDKIAAFGSAEAAHGYTKPSVPKPFFMTIGDKDPIVNPRLMWNSFKYVERVNGSTGDPQPFGDKGKLYSGNAPVVMWEHDGGHGFNKDCLPDMLKFFKMF